MSCIASTRFVSALVVSAFFFFFCRKPISYERIRVPFVIVHALFIRASSMPVMLVSESVKREINYDEYPVRQKKDKFRRVLPTIIHRMFC